jgi:acetyltransferase-like isoleucine patch superfamily enzyme
MLDGWRLRSRDPRQARFLTLSSLRWVAAKRAYTPWYLLRYWRFLRFKLANPHVVTTGFVFLGKNVELLARPGYGRLVLGRWVHVGDGTSLRCHEGSLSIGDKVVFGRNNVVNCYLDISIGPACILADMIYVTDFDHVFSDAKRPIKDQGIAKSPVRIGADVWLANKVSVVRGTMIGDGSVVAANAVVTRDLPPYSVAVGVPARVIRNRREDHDAAAGTRAAIADMASKLGLDPSPPGPAPGSSQRGSAPSRRQPGSALAGDQPDQPSQSDRPTPDDQSRQPD